MAIGKKNEISEITCSACGSIKKVSEFYTSFSDFHKATGRLNVCKKCLLESVKADDVKSFQGMLRKLDKPFISHLYESAIQVNAYVGEYFKLINAKDFRFKTWDDSDFDGHKKATVITNRQKFDNIDINDDMDELNEDDVKFMKSFWGKGYELDDLIWLQKEYEDWTNRYECDSKGMETLIQEICKQQLDINIRRSNGEKVDQQLKTLQDLLGSSNLKPVQETGANAVEQESFGTLIKKFEREKPIPEPDAAWKDVDGIGKYIRTFFFGHMARATGVENKFQDEYEEELSKYTVKQEDLDGDNDE